MESETPTLYDSTTTMKTQRPDLFIICSCSEVNKDDLDVKAPTKFLQSLCDSIDFKTQIAYTSLGDDIYKITSPIPDDSDVIEVQWCLDFLYLAYNDEELISKSNKNHITDPTYKYLTLWSFIYGFLGIKDSSYDYILMNYLEHKDYISHGVGIRCANLNVKRDPPSKEFRDMVMKWVNECDSSGNNYDIKRPWLVEL